jgi:hypothetical protein
LIQKVLLLGGGLMAAGGFASGSPMVGGGGLLSMLGGASPMLMSMMNSGGPPPGKAMGGAPSEPTPNEGFKSHNELTAQGPPAGAPPAAPPAPSWMQTAQNFAGINPVSNWNIPGAESLYNTVMPRQGYSMRPGGPVPR